MRNWKEVDSALKSLGNIGDKIQSHEASMNKEIAGIEKNYNPKIKKLQEDKETLEKDLREFLEENQKELREAGTKEFLHGEISLAKDPPALETKGNTKWETVMDNIKTILKPSEKKGFIKVTEKLQKNIVKKAPAEILKKIGLKLASGYTYSIKTYKKNVKGK